MTTTYPLDEIRELCGPNGLMEFEAAHDSMKPDLLKFARNLKDYSDTRLVRDGEYWILESARMQGYRGNFEDVHFKATAFYYESQRRKLAAGHTKDCQGDTLYVRAYNAAYASQGHTPSEPQSCTCGLVK